MQISLSQIPFLLIVTIVVEYLIILSMTRKEPFKVLFYSILVNCITWPPAMLLYTGGMLQLLLIETAIFAVEAVLLKLLLQIKFRKAAMLSLAANAATALLGVALSMI